MHNKLSCEFPPEFWPLISDSEFVESPTFYFSELGHLRVQRFLSGEILRLFFLSSRFFPVILHLFPNLRVSEIFFHRTSARVIFQCQKLIALPAAARTAAVRGTPGPQPTRGPCPGVADPPPEGYPSPKKCLWPGGVAPPWSSESLKAEGSQI